MKTPQEHIDFIRCNATPIALCAWAGYLCQENGVVRIEFDTDNKIKRELPDFINEPTMLKILNLRDGSREARMLMDYSPEDEVVVLFGQKNDCGGTIYHTYRHATKPAPRKAYDLWFMNPDMWTLND